MLPDRFSDVTPRNTNAVYCRRCAAHAVVDGSVDLLARLGRRLFYL